MPIDAMDDRAGLDIDPSHLEERAYALDTGDSRTLVGSMLPPMFLRELGSAVKQQLKAQGQTVETHLRSRLVQFWFGDDKTVHYEVWAHERTNQLELGLHCESTAERNREIYLRLECDLVYVQSRLGSSIWLEEWDRGWARIYETERLWPLDHSRLVTTTQRLCEVISVLQPMLKGL